MLDCTNSDPSWVGVVMGRWVAKHYKATCSGWTDAPLTQWPHLLQMPTEANTVPSVTPPHRIRRGVTPPRVALAWTYRVSTGSIISVLPKPIKPVESTNKQSNFYVADTRDKVPSCYITANFFARQILRNCLQETVLVVLPVYCHVVHSKAYWDCLSMNIEEKV